MYTHDGLPVHLYSSASILPDTSYVVRQQVLITARIRRMTEGNVFTLSTISGGGGTPSQVRGGGNPIPGPDRGGSPHHDCMEYPPP